MGKGKKRRQGPTGEKATEAAAAPTQAPRSAPLVAPPFASPMQIGTKVRIKNLRTIELNERLGKVIGFNNESGRFAVAIASDPMDTTLAAWQAGGEDEGPMTQSVFLKPGIAQDHEPMASALMAETFCSAPRQTLPLRLRR